jgi:hypothetical protein
VTPKNFGAGDGDRTRNVQLGKPSGERHVQIEVKGLDADTGRVVFTSKEWDAAKNNDDSYFLVIVRNVSSNPTVQLICNPARVLKPRKNIFTTAQVQWSVSDVDLAHAAII